MANTVYEQCLAGMVPQFEEQVAEVVALAPWLEGWSGTLFRQVVACHFEMVYGQTEVDLGVMAELTGTLAHTAETVGDRRRAFAFTHWQAWALAAERGEEYQMPDLPEALAVLP